MRATSRFALTLCVTSLLSGTVSAQNEPITIRFNPTPNTTIRMNVSQAMTLDMTMDGAPALPNGFGQTMEITVATTASAPEPDGRFSLDAVFEALKASVTLNGKQAPLPDADANPLIGKHIVATYMPDGTMVDAKSDALDPAMLAVMKQMVTRFGFSAPMTVAIGETITRPNGVEMPGGLPGLTGVNMKSEAKMTLVSVSVDNGNRIAHFDVTTTADIDQDVESPLGPASPLHVTLHMQTSGTTDIDVASGVTLRSEQRGTMDAVVNGMPARGGTGAMRMKGTIENKVDALSK